MSEFDPCPNCGEAGEGSEKHYRGVRCNNGSCKVKVYDDHSYSDFTDELVKVKNYEGFVKNDSNRIWLLDEKGLETERGNGNCITSIIQQMTGEKVKATLRKLKEHEEEEESSIDVFEEEKKHFGN